MKCENKILKGVVVPGKPYPNTTLEPCPNEAHPGLVCCYHCLWLYSEEQYKRYKLEREERRGQIKSEIAYIWDLCERLPPKAFLERYSLEERGKELWEEIQKEEEIEDENA